MMLNGAQFDEAPVKVGDRLRIGPVELEIVECNQPPAASQAILPRARIALGCKISSSRSR